MAGCCPGYLKVELPLTWDWLFLIIMMSISIQYCKRTFTILTIHTIHIVNIL
nr:MAG TPA: hypothetical protein [Caudoviricetes sp.]